MSPHRIGDQWMFLTLSSVIQSNLIHRMRQLVEERVVWRNAFGSWRVDETRVESRKSQMERIAHRQRNRDRHEPGASEICKTDALWALLYFILHSSFLSNWSARFGLFVFSFHLLLVVLGLPCCTWAFSRFRVWASHHDGSSCCRARA